MYCGGFCRVFQLTLDRRFREAMRPYIAGMGAAGEEAAEDGREQYPGPLWARLRQTLDVFRRPAGPRRRGVRGRGRPRPGFPVQPGFRPLGPEGDGRGGGSRQSGAAATAWRICESRRTVCEAFSYRSQKVNLPKQRFQPGQSRHGTEHRKRARTFSTLLNTFRHFSTLLGISWPPSFTRLLKNTRVRSRASARPS